MQKLTDEQIRALMEKNRYEPVNCGVTASVVHELCTRVLDAEAEAAAYKASYEKVHSEANSMAANQCHDGYGDEWGNHRCRVQDALRARVKVLEDALRPFAEEIADVVFASDADNVVYTGLNGHKAYLRISDFRRARAALGAQ